MLRKEQARHLFQVVKITLLLAPAGWAFYMLWQTGFDLEALIGKVENTRPEYFFFAMSLFPLAGFTISAFYLFAGIAFYWPLALGLCLSAIAVNLLFSYGLTHSLLKNPLGSLLAKAGYKLPQIPKHYQCKAILLVRLMPVAPFFVQNYLLALGGAQLWPFFCLSLCLQGLIGSAIVLIGQPFLGGKTQWVALGLAILILILFFGFKRYWGAKKTKTN